MLGYWPSIKSIAEKIKKLEDGEQIVDYNKVSQQIAE